jgi:hypothetical protein
MKTKTIGQMLVLWGIAACICSAPGFAAGGVHCQDIGGGVLTNFLPIDSPACASSFQNLCTEGTSTGNIKGGVGVAIIGVTSGPNGTTVYHVQHHWVTDSGDTIFLKDAFLTAFPTPDPNRVLADYLNGSSLWAAQGALTERRASLCLRRSRFEAGPDNLALRRNGVLPDGERAVIRVLAP